jgi:hypothetical protein
MNRFTHAVEAELALLKRAIHEATHNKRWTPARVLVIPAAMAGLVSRILRSHASEPNEPQERRHRGAYAWDARGRIVQMPSEGSMPPGGVIPTAPTPKQRAQRKHRNSGPDRHHQI